MSSTSTRARRGGDALVMQVARHLTERDHRILDLVAEHRVFTTEQMCEMFFGNMTTARHRLTKLHELRLLDRFAPFRATGSAPYHYVLGELGACVVAAHRGIEPKAVRWRPERMLALSRSFHLAHLAGVNGFFTSLAGAARKTPGAALVRWFSESRCAGWIGDAFQVRPDGYGVWSEDGETVEFFLEHDRHTEPLERLVGKVGRYHDLMDLLAHSFGQNVVVLFCFGSPRREAGARRVLANTTMPIATAALAAGQRPHEAVWLPLGTSGPRRRLVDVG
jgi:hypothetical protein